MHIVVRFCTPMHSTECYSYSLFMQKLIGASLSEPHINGTSMRELYIYILWYVGHVGIIASYGHKREIVYCAFSCLTLRAVYMPF